MDLRYCSDSWIETERESRIGWLWWWSDAARPRPEESVSLRRFAALRHIGEKACLLIRRDLVLSNVALLARAVVKTIPLDVPPRAHVDFSIPGRPFLRKLLAKSFGP